MSPIETLYKASVPNKFSNWQRLFTRSTVTVKVTRLLALQVYLPTTPPLILLLRNHGFWIAEQPITLHLIHNFSHTLHHHLFQMLICPQTQLHSSHLQAQLNKFNDKIKITLKDVLCVPSFNLNLMSISKITSSLNCCVVFTLHGCVVQDLATGRMIGSINNTQVYTTCPIFQTKPTHLKYRPTLIYGTSASDILLQRVYNLYLPYYLSLSVKISLFPFIIIVVLNRQRYPFL